MIEYITTKEASEKWEISRRRVNTLCQEGKIPNIAKVGNMWLIPSDATKPFTIEETISEEFIVTADSIEDAMQIAIDKYQKEEVVLSPGNLENKQIMLYDKSNDTYSDWIEF